MTETPIQTAPTTSTPTLRRRAEIPTPQASRYLQQLCKHFQHKIPVTFDPTEGRIEFSMGISELRAEPAVLVLEVVARDPADLPTLEDVIARHLVRFAFREEIAITWSDA